MKKLWFVLLAAGLLLGGCRTAPTSTPTQIRVETTPSVRELKSTQIPTETPRLTPWPTPIPTPTPAIVLPEAGAAYRLVTPELDFLVGQYFTYWETREVTEFLAAHYYLEGSLPYQSVLDYVNQSDPIIFFSPYFQDLVTQTISDYIVDNNFDFEQKNDFQSGLFSSRAERVELDGDPGPEWLVGFDVGKLFLQGWFTFNQTGSGEFQLLTSPSSFASHSYSPISPTLSDFDLDGNDDLLIMAEAYLGGGGNSGVVNIYRGSSNGFTLEYEFDYFYNSKWSDGFWFIKLGETEPPSVVITNEKTLNWGCEWTYTITVAWENGQFRETHAGEKPPNTPECLIAQSVHWIDEFPESGISDLTAAINQITNNPAYHPDLEAFARFRLALLYAIDGNIAGVRTQLEAIETLSENPEAKGAQFIAEQLPDILLEDQTNLPQLCSLLIYQLNDGDPISEFWENYVWNQAWPEVYNGSILCPVGLFLNELLETMPPPSSPSLEIKLQDIGIQLITLESYISSDGQTLWLGMFNDHDPIMAIYAPNDDGIYTWELIYSPPQFKPFDVQWIFKDISGDGIPEMSYAYHYPYKEVDGIKKYAIYLTAVDDGNIISDIMYHDLNRLDLEQFLREEYGETLIENILEENAPCGNIHDSDTWFRLDTTLHDLDLATCTNYDSIYDIQTWALDRNLDAEARALLEHARDLVDLDDDYGPEAWQNLSYLIALSHELEGSTCEAIAGYLAVWESHPVTPWNALAASHLEAAGPDANAPACSAE